MNHLNYFYQYRGAVVVVIVWYMDLQLPMQSVPITTNVLNSNSAHDEVYSIQHYVIKFVSDLRQVGGFLRVLSPVSSINKTDHHDITEILLKVALNSILLILFVSTNCFTANQLMYISFQSKLIK